MATQHDILLVASRRDYEQLRKLVPVDRYSQEMDNVEEIIRNIGINYRDVKLLKSYPFKYRIALEDNINNPSNFEFILQVLYIEEPICLVDVPSYVIKAASPEILSLLLKYKIEISLLDLSDENRLIYLQMVPIDLSLAIKILDYVCNNDLGFDNELIKVLTNAGYYPPPVDSNYSIAETLDEWLTELESKYKNEIRRSKFSI